jgi:hypothetical protein
VKVVTEMHVKAWVKEWFDAQNAWHYAPIQNGLGVHGIPDRVGCVPVTITPDMVGQKFGLFVAVEAKRPGRRGERDMGLSKHQLLVLDAINEAGGTAIVCDGFEDLRELSLKLVD